MKIRNIDGTVIKTVKGSSLVGADLSETNLVGANLTGADLTRASLFASNLSDAQLTEADLHGADLCGANLLRADLTGANLSEADLTKTIFHNLNGLAYIKDGRKHWFLFNEEYEDEKLYCAARDMLLALFPDLKVPQQQEQEEKDS